MTSPAVPRPHNPPPDSARAVAGLASAPRQAERAAAGTIVQRLVLAGAVLWAALALWAGRGYVPIWDGRVYADCAVRAATQPFSLEALRCADHPTHAYIGLLALGQRLSPGSMPLLLATNAALLALAAVAFARLLRVVFPDPALSLERTLLVAALLVDPVVLAGMLQVNVDFGVLVFFLCATAALMEGRRALAIVLGLLCAFSKETGALLYGGLVGAWWLATVLPRPIPRQVRNALLAAMLAFAMCMLTLPWRTWTIPVAAVAAIVAARAAHEGPIHVTRLRGAATQLVALWPLAIPLAAVAAYMWLRPMLVPSTAALWGGWKGESVVRQLLFPQLNTGVRDYLALVFVVNFHWIVGGVLAIDAAVGARRLFVNRGPRPVAGASADSAWRVVLIALVGVYLITRIQTAIIARYMMPVYPLVFAAFLASLLRLKVAAWARRAALGTFVVLMVLSARRTIDPVSRAVWGTFPVGRHEMLFVNSMTGGCCGFGLDQSLYNLEFLNFATLTQTALDRIQPARGGAVVTAAAADWHMVGPVDARSRRRLWAPDGTVPTVRYAEDLAQGRTAVDSAWYLEYPYVPNDAALAALAARYDVGAPDTLWVDGYALPLRRLTARRRP